VVKDAVIGGYNDDAVYPAATDTENHPREDGHGTITATRSALPAHVQNQDHGSLQRRRPTSRRQWFGAASWWNSGAARETTPASPKPPLEGPNDRPQDSTVDKEGSVMTA